jgi:hypothetical protein
MTKVPRGVGVGGEDMAGGIRVGESEDGVHGMGKAYGKGAFTIVCKKREEYSRVMLERYPEPEDWYHVRFCDECHFGWVPRTRSRSFAGLDIPFSATLGFLP